MKMISNLIIVILIALFGFNNAISCPTGYTSIAKVITVGDCDYIVDICVKCPTGPVPGFITLTGFTLVDPNCNNSLNINQVFEGIKAAIMNFTFIQDLCAQLQAPPCNEAQPITFIWYNCWKKERINYFGVDHIYYSACDYDTYCEITKIYCWNGQDFTITIVSGPTQNGEPDCPYSYPPDPENYNEPTNCFRIHTECDD
jgi:hypothetical protein